MGCNNKEAAGSFRSVSNPNPNKTYSAVILDDGSGMGEPLRWFMVSNNPERLCQFLVSPGSGQDYAVTPAVLWHHQVPHNLNDPNGNTSARTARHRVFVWHYNDSGTSGCLDQGVQKPPTNMHVGHTIENIGEGSISVTGKRYLRVVSLGAARRPGRCIAEMTLGGGTFEAYATHPVSNLLPGQGPRLIESILVDAGRVVGGQFELDVQWQGTPTQKFHYKLRDVIGTSQASLPSVTGPLAAQEPTATRPRGGWKGHTISFTIPPDPGKLATVQCENGSFNYSKDNPLKVGIARKGLGGGEDIVFLTSTSFDPANAETNVGNWGVTYQQITVTGWNGCIQAFDLVMEVYARGRGI